MGPGVAVGLGAALSPLPLPQLRAHIGNRERSPLLGRAGGREAGACWGRKAGLLGLGFTAVPGLAPQEPRRRNTGFATSPLPPGWESARPRCPTGAAASPAVAPSGGEGAAVLGKGTGWHELPSVISWRCHSAGFQLASLFPSLP